MGNLIFISSPYSHLDPNVIEKNFQDVTELVAFLTSQGITAISPITYGHTLLNYMNSDNDWDTWKDFCLTFLSKSTELWVYKMPGWNRSRGVAEEIEYAVKNNLHIKYIDYEYYKT
jgi:hypothetical protein